MTDADPTRPPYRPVICGRPNGYPARECTREYGHDGNHWHADLHGAVDRAIRDATAALSAELVEAKAEVERLRGERFEAVMALAWLAPSVTQNGRLAHAVRVAREALIAAEAERDALAAQLDGLRAGIRHMAGLMAEAPGTYADAIRDVATDTIQRIESLLGGDENEARTDG